MQENYHGLSEKEALELLTKNGPNSLPEEPAPSNFAIFFSQLKSPLVYILVFAGLVSLFLSEYPDLIIISVAILINTILGFVQERKAGNALHALKKLIHPNAIVIRGGVQVKIPIENVVVGDICVLNQGDKIPADGVMTSGKNLFLSEAIITGESVSVEKKIDEQVYMGTSVIAGKGYMKVDRTGEDTQIGKIALQIQKIDGETPLKKQMISFSKQLSILILGLTSLVFVFGLIKGENVVEMFKTSVALAVSAIPEGLLVSMTVVLAIGMQRILKRKGLVRNLVSAETLGGVSTICVDKTGTLTQGLMQVTKIEGNEELLVRQVIVANDMDDPIVIAAHDWASKIRNEDDKSSKLEIRNLTRNFSRLDSIPFSSKNRFFASLNKFDSKNNILFVNGAPEFILDWSKMKTSDRDKYSELIEEYSRSGMRLVGYGYKKVSKSKSTITDKDAREGLTFVGLIAFSDPVRPDIKKSFDKAKKAGIRTIVITGDYAGTALSVMKEIGLSIEEENVITGEELKNISEKDLMSRVKNHNQVMLFARTTPEQKLIIVDALQKSGETVAMMGDGVNDAPALKTSDIGIVVGDATDVAKESADLVLLDSSFETILAAVEEGRGIFDNLRKIILYLMSDAFEEIVLVVATMFLGLPLPISAAQILWINLISDGLPSLALTVDTKEKDIMEMPPRPQSEKLVAGWIKVLIAIVSLTGGVVALIIFVYYLKGTGDVRLARSIAFAVLGMNSLFYVFSIKTLHDSFWEENPFANKWLNVSFLIGMVLQIAPFMTETTRNFLNLSELNIGHWMVVVASSVGMFILIEVVKDIASKTGLRHLDVSRSL